MRQRPRRAQLRVASPIGRPNRQAGGEQGMVTVELAVGLAVVVFVLGAVTEAAGAATTHTRLCSQVRDAARAASIGQTIPSGGTGELSVHRAGRWVVVSGRAVTGGPSGMFGIRVGCELSMLVEQSVP